MNLDSIYQCSQTCKVVSKYFSTCTVMDESLSHFQEKKCYTAPKNSSNSKTIKLKTRKPVKRIKGQKDIRTALKSKKNEIILYSKEFDKVCKQSGVDVDPEQLQLAIALSNSLRDKESSAQSNTAQSSASNSQTRISKIRTTLQQYGFKVPVTKISGRKVKKYKLLTISDGERLQLITDKYTQVLLHNLDKSKIIDKDTEFGVSQEQLINIATNIPYKYLKNNEVFYVDNLVEKSDSTGSLLRNWSDIPGRPVSPIKIITKDNKMNIEIDYSQEELDLVLSGSIQCSKIIMSRKDNFFQKEPVKSIVLHDKVGSCNENPTQGMNFKEVIDLEKSIHKENCVTEIHSEEPKLLPVTQYRSCSPDIFDDEVSIVDDTDLVVVDNIINDLKYERLKPLGDVMNLTECVNFRTQNTTILGSQLSQKDDVTKRRSNDFMEMTECVATTSQPILENHNIVDLTQTCNHNYDGAVKHKDVCTESLDLTQSSDSSVDLPFVHIGHKQTEESNDDTIIINDYEYLEINKNAGSKNIEEENRNACLEENGKECVDLTQDESVIQSKNFQTNKGSFFEEYDCDHSENHDIVNLNDHNNFEKSTDQINDIDLTQSSNSSNDTYNKTPNYTINKNKNSDNLGQCDISIDYDDLFDEVCESANELSKTVCKNTVQSNTSSQTYNSSNNEEINKIPLDVLSSSQNSEVFEISDRELDYSMHKSRLETETSLAANSSGFRNTTNALKSYLFVNDLPMLEIEMDDKNNKVHVNETTPIKQLNNGDYIIRTEGVTPMPDYESMSSPDRNKELDKYGLKPFKRKRAINLLTYLYNQTHPLAEPCSYEELPSPSKKLKTDSKLPMTSPKTSRSPIKTCVGKSNCSPKNSNLISSPNKEYIKENECQHDQTNELPMMKEVICDEEDWVFQKREKAKVHSCRVPLHIAFHNYVSCRRELREAILRYEPINIDVVHKDLLHSGHRYDPRDLLKFLDKKCITVKTTENNGRNNKR